MKNLSFVFLLIIIFLFNINISYSQDYGYRIEINIPSCTLSVYKDGIVIARYPVAVGSPETQTPVGQYKIVSKETDPLWYPPWPTPVVKVDKNGKEYTVMEYPTPIPAGPDNPLGKYWMGLDREQLGIHSTNNPGSVGYSVSHGCIRMSPEDVTKVFNLVEVGTIVDIVYKTTDMIIEPHIGQIFMTSYPDIYSKGRDSFETVKGRLDKTGIPYDVTLVRNAMEKQNGSYNIVSMPYNMLLDGEKVPVNTIYPVEPVIKGKKQFYLSVKDWNKVSLNKIVWISGKNKASINGAIIESIIYDGKSYVNVRELSKILDIEYMLNLEKRNIVLYSVMMSFNGQSIEADGKLINDRPYISVKTFSDYLGINFSWNPDTKEVSFGDSKFKCKFIGGKAFVPVERLTLDFALLMERKNKRNIELYYPSIYLNGVSLFKKSFLYQGEIYIALKELQNITGIKFIWDSKSQTVNIGEGNYPGKQFGNSAFLPLSSLYKLGCVDIKRPKYDFIEILVTKIIINDKFYCIQSYKDGSNNEVMISVDDFVKASGLLYSIDNNIIIINNKKFNIQKRKDGIYVSLGDLRLLPGMEIDYSRNDRVIRMFVNAAN